VSPVDLLRDGLLRPRHEAAQPVRDGLQEWMEEADERGQDVPSPVPPVRAEGPCAVCGQREATTVCHQCGQGVCGGDQWLMFGLCRACLTPEEMERARTKGRPRPDLGIKWVDER
jgi:ribosomal protein S14